MSLIVIPLFILFFMPLFYCSKSKFEIKSKPHGSVNSKGTYLLVFVVICQVVCSHNGAFFLPLFEIKKNQTTQTVVKASHTSPMTLWPAVLSKTSSAMAALLFSALFCPVRAIYIKLFLEF